MHPTRAVLFVLNIIILNACYVPPKPAHHRQYQCSGTLPFVSEVKVKPQLIINHTDYVQTIGLASTEAVEARGGSVIFSDIDKTVVVFQYSGDPAKGSFVEFTSESASTKVEQFMSIPENYMVSLRGTGPGLRYNETKVYFEVELPDYKVALCSDTYGRNEYGSDEFYDIHKAQYPAPGKCQFHPGRDPAATVNFFFESAIEKGVASITKDGVEGEVKELDCKYREFDSED